MLPYNKMKILNASDPDFGVRFREALGLKIGDKVVIRGPQFNRTDGRIVSYVPDTPEEYENLHKLSRANLIKIGCCIWETTKSQTHWLYPGEWFESIPEGTEILSINGRREAFHKETESDDIRFGCLAYGFLQKEEQDD